MPGLRQLEEHVTTLAAPTSPTVSPVATLLSSLQRLPDNGASISAAVALTGAGCHLPRGLVSLPALARAATSAHDTVASVPATRWKAEDQEVRDEWNARAKTPATSDEDA